MNRTLNVPRKKTQDIPEEGKDRVNFRCDPEWYLKVATHAASLGMDITNFIRFACVRQIERDLAESAALRPPPKR